MTQTSSTLRAAVKAYLETQGLGVPIYAGRVPAGQALPYIRIYDGIGEAPDRTQDGVQKRTTEQVQVDVWQNLSDKTTNTIAESPTLAENVKSCLRSARLVTAPKYVYRTLIFDRVRQEDEENNVVGDRITLNVRRRLD